MRISILVAMLFALAFQVATATKCESKTLRTAKVVVINNTGKELTKITVYHKYSNIYKEEHTWDKLLPDGASTEASINFRYHTGFLTTGVDWWIVVFKDKAGNEYVSDPQNFRKLIDGLESILLGAVPLLTSIVTPGGGLVKDASEIAARALLNTEKTFHEKLGVGYEVHTLRKQDANTILQITLRKAEEKGVLIKSADGNRDSNLDYKALSAEQTSIINDFTIKALERLQKEVEAELKKKRDALLAADQKK